MFVDISENDLGILMILVCNLGLDPNQNLDLVNLNVGS